MVSYNAMVMNFNTKEMESYDIMPYMYRAWNANPMIWVTDPETKEYVMKEIKTLDDFKSWFQQTARYEFWARTEYEFIMVEWPYLEGKPIEDQVHQKIDVWKQIKMNFDVVSELMWNDLVANKKVNVDTTK